MARATITLKRWLSTSCSASRTRAVGDLAQRDVTVGDGSAPGSDVTSPLSRQARCRKRTDPLGDMSAQSMSSSGGPAKTRVSRTASTPYADSCSPNLTPLPLDFDILAPSLMTMPWFSWAENGSPNSSSPMSRSTMVKNRAYSRCSTACSTPPM